MNLNELKSILSLEHGESMTVYLKISKQNLKGEQFNLKNFYLRI